MGYKVARVLDHYHRNNINMLLSDSQLKSEIKDDLPTLSSTDLKVSIATNSNDSWSKTFDLNSQTLVNRGKTISSICKVPYPIILDILKNIIVVFSNLGSDTLKMEKSRHVEIPMSNDTSKLYFLATGTGCASLKVC